MTELYYLAVAKNKIEISLAKDEQKEKVTDLYLKIIPIMKQYNIDRGQIKHG